MSEPSLIPHSRPTIGDDDRRAVEALLRTDQVGGGEAVRHLEAALAEAVGRREARCVSSGTAALHLALAALEVGPGDEVILPSYTCAALLHAVHMVGAAPVLIDVAPDGNVTPTAVAAAARQQTGAAIIPHMSGLPAAIEEIVELGIPVIEDAAQAIGATRADRPVGSFGRISVFSFYATKMLTTGHGGALATDDDDLAHRIDDLTTYDQRQEYRVSYNYAMSALAAALGLAQIRRLAEFVEKRREIAAAYAAGLADLPCALPRGDGHIFYRYVVACDRPIDDVVEAMARAGVETKGPVFRPLHQYLPEPPSCPVAEALDAHALSIPCYPSLTERERDHVIRELSRVLAG